MLIDCNLKPWLIEVNASPSMGVDSEVDVRVKSKMIADTVNLVRAQGTRRGGGAEAGRGRRQGGGGGRAGGGERRAQYLLLSCVPAAPSVATAAPAAPPLSPRRCLQCYLPPRLCLHCYSYGKPLPGHPAKAHKQHTNTHPTPLVSACGAGGWRACPACVRACAIPAGEPPAL